MKATLVPFKRSICHLHRLGGFRVSEWPWSGGRIQRSRITAQRELWVLSSVFPSWWTLRWWRGRTNGVARRVVFVPGAMRTLLEFPALVTLVTSRLWRFELPMAVTVCEQIAESFASTNSAIAL